MSEPKRNDWFSPSAILGVVGLLAAGVATYSKFDGRISIQEAAAQQTDKRLERLETKVDFLVGQVAGLNGGKT